MALRGEAGGVDGALRARAEHAAGAVRALRARHCGARARRRLPHTVPHVSIVQSISKIISFQ